MSTPQPPADAGQGHGALVVTALVVGIAALLVGLVPFLGLLVGATSTTSSTAVPAPSPSRPSAPSTPSPSVTRPTPSTLASPSTPAEPALPSGDLGDTVGGIDSALYTVTDLTCGLPTLGEGALTVTAQGQFCVADVTVTNRSGTPMGFSARNATAYAGKAGFAADTDAGTSADPRAAAGPIDLDQSRPNKVVFDVPPGTALDRTVLTTTRGDLVNGEKDLDPGVSIRLS